MDGRQGKNRHRAGAAVLAGAIVAAAAAVGGAAAAPPTPEPGGCTPGSAEVQHLHYRYGPIHVAPGQNLILVGPVTIEKPCYDGFVIRMRPNLVRDDGTVPPTDVIHLHHGVFLNASARRGTEQRFFATGEEKTVLRLPPGYGLPVRGTDTWLMNYMVHNQTPVPDNVWLTYDLDYVPANSALGRRLIPVKPVWMDVQNGSAYPVFDVHRGSGRHGRFTYPDQARPNPYGRRRPKNEWRAPADGTLVAGAGHVHPGGLWTDLDVIRGHRRRLILHSKAHYWDPNGPVSWDMAMTGSRPNWRVALRKGDRLRLSATYETHRASWYESMGIDLLYMAPASRRAVDPFRHRVPTGGTITHGRLPENSNHGGTGGGVDPRTLPDGQTVFDGVGIEAFTYTPGNLGLAGPLGNPPVVKQGGSLQFENFEPGGQIFHTVTACRTPCNASTGVSYPLANGPVDFDSGDLGYGPTGLTAAANRVNWKTPTSLRPGTYTYFCRIHPYMRGAFRVIPK